MSIWWRMQLQTNKLKAPWQKTSGVCLLPRYISVPLKLTKAGILLFSLPTWCFPLIQFSCDLYPRRGSQCFLCLWSVPLWGCSRKPCLHYWLKDPLTLEECNSVLWDLGVLDSTHANIHASLLVFFSPGVMLGLTQLMLVCAPSLCSHAWICSSNRPLSSWSPKSQRRFSGGQTKYAFIY